MTTETQPSSTLEMKVETNSAPTEQRSVEMVTTDPKEVEAPISDNVIAEPEQPKAIESDEMARRAFIAEAKAAELERQNKDLLPKTKEFTERPKIENYASLEAYEADLEAYVEGKARAKFDGELTQKQQAEQASRIQAELQLKATQARAKYKDFDQVVQPLAGVMDSIPILRDFNANNPLGLEVSYELAKQPALLEQLKRAPLWEAGEMLINMAARLKKPATVQQSNAPEPIKPVGSRETAPKKLHELDMNSFVAKRNKQERERRKRIH